MKQMEKEVWMSIRFSALLLALPIMVSGAHAAPAPSSDLGDHAPVVSAPAPQQAAMPAGCGGCVNHDCANCPLHMAAVGAKDAQSAHASETPCTDK
jgi:hypothetical protein